MQTECTRIYNSFQALGRREIVADFSGGTITSDGGGLLLREVEQRTGILQRFAKCFTDYRDAKRIEHSVLSLVSQRVIGLALGYEDLNDHDHLAKDQMLAIAVGKNDPTGMNRKLEQDKGKPLAGKSTLNRLELTAADATAQSPYKKIVISTEAVDNLLVDVFLEMHSEAPARIILDVDATDDPLHGNQEGKFFHGYYKAYCYLPLYIFCGDHLLCARLRQSNNDGAAGTVEEVDRIVERIRTCWPDTRIIVRGDSGFCREDLMVWCEDHDVDFLLGLARNRRLELEVSEELALAKALYQCSEKASRVFRDFCYKPLKTWRWHRRVVGKAEHLGKGANPRFVVTSLKAGEHDARELYEKMYCARGEMENRIKEQQLMLFADRTSTHKMFSNQIRLYFSSLAYVLVQALRQLGLTGTDMSRAQCDTIRLKLFKIGAKIRITVRKVWISFTDGYPYRRIFNQVLANMEKIPLWA
ncbi:MAG: IS1380 family transposase [Desulfocapsaceae bacterium]|nr:IS1380 family transposase [Desulfocapsaceae bacterium]